MKVVSYLKTVPARNSNPQKEELLINFAKGVNAVGDTGIVSDSNTVVDADVGVIQGWVYSNITSQHLKLRNSVIRSQTVVTADANLFLYNDPRNPYGYLRYSFNGIFPTTGIYCDTEIDPKRWQQISDHTGIQIEDYKRSGSDILLLLQRNGGWSLKGVDVISWTVDTVRRLRKYTDRKIIIRTHPGDKKTKIYLNELKRRIKNFSNVVISNVGTPLHDDLKNTWAVVNHNSSAAVGPIIQGYNCFLTDPEDSQCREVSSSDFSTIENPKEYDRQAWLERISMFHWNFEELNNGACWRHMREFV